MDLPRISDPIRPFLSIHRPGVHRGTAAVTKHLDEGVQYKSVSMRKVGLEKISGISNSRCKRFPIPMGAAAVLRERVMSVMMVLAGEIYLNAPRNSTLSYSSGPPAGGTHQILKT